MLELLQLTLRVEAELIRPTGSFLAGTSPHRPAGITVQGDHRRPAPSRSDPRFTVLRADRSPRPRRGRPYHELVLDETDEHIEAGTYGSPITITGGGRISPPNRGDHHAHVRRGTRSPALRSATACSATSTSRRSTTLGRPAACSRAGPRRRGSPTPRNQDTFICTRPKPCQRPGRPEILDQPRCRTMRTGLEQDEQALRWSCTPDDTLAVAVQLDDIERTDAAITATGRQGFRDGAVRVTAHAPPCSPNPTT